MKKQVYRLPPKVFSIHVFFFFNPWNHKSATTMRKVKKHVESHSFTHSGCQIFKISKKLCAVVPFGLRKSWNPYVKEKYIWRKSIKNTPPAQIRNCPRSPKWWNLYILKRIIKEIYQKNTSSPDTKLPPVSEIMKSIYFKRNYTGNLLKKHPQPRYETAPRSPKSWIS